MKPSVGRIVHFYQQASDAPEISGPFAAIVTHAYDEPDQAINLVVFTELGGTRAERLVSIKDYGGTRYWEWPPRDAASVPAVIDPKALPAPAMPEAVILSGYVPAFEVEAFDPLRRNNSLRQSPAEFGIFQAMAAVEMIGAHPWLTDAVVLLANARDKVADYYDRIPAEAPQRDDAGEPLVPPFQRERDAASERRVDDTGEDIDPSLRA